MAKSIELVTVLEGEHARAFHEYMGSNVLHDTPESRKIMSVARDLSKRFKFL
jgi:hypothetical protein